MSGFSIDWLNLREAADLRARDRELLGAAWQLLQTASASGPSTVVDLGAGTGATVRAFSLVAAEGLHTHDGAAPNTANFTIDWRLVDHDTTLLTEAISRHGADHQITTWHADLSEPAALPLQKARLITASALFDLVSADVIAGLATAIAKPGIPAAGVYAALNYDGVTQWSPDHPLDTEVLQAFNRDQQRDKGMGPALGPAAADHLADVFQQAGFQVRLAESPWLLDGKDAALLGELINGIYEAVRNDPGLNPQMLLDWREFRLSNVATGTCKVGHKDFLALPPE